MLFKVNLRASAISERDYRLSQNVETMRPAR